MNSVLNTVEMIYSENCTKLKIMIRFDLVDILISISQNRYYTLHTSFR